MADSRLYRNSTTKNAKYAPSHLIGNGSATLAYYANPNTCLLIAETEEKTVAILSLRHRDNNHREYSSVDPEKFQQNSSLMLLNKTQLEEIVTSMDCLTENGILDQDVAFLEETFNSIDKKKLGSQSRVKVLELLLHGLSQHIRDTIISAETQAAKSKPCVIL